MELLEGLDVIAPDVIVIDTDSPDRDMLEHLAAMSRDAPRPVVLFTDDEDIGKMKQALRAGVMSYVVGDVAADRIKAILQVAVARFEENQALRQELENAKTELASRKLIERAKGIVMTHKGVREDEAYRLLREMAMSRRVKLADVAQQVIDMSSMFS
jgi:two-component system, response regulator / RNA-binding antiterminator